VARAVWTEGLEGPFILPTELGRKTTLPIHLPLLPLAPPVKPTGLRIKRKPQISKFRPKDRKRFRPRARVTESSVNEVPDDKEEEEDHDAEAKIDSKEKLHTREPASKLNKKSKKVHSSRFSAFGRRPKPGVVGSDRRREDLGAKSEEEKLEDRETTIPQRQPTTLQVSATTLSPLKLEDFFGTPEPVAPRELLPTREPQALRSEHDRLPGPLLAPRIPLALGNDLGSSESLLDAVRTQTSALTGAQALGVTREVTKQGRREHARQLPLGPIQPDLVDRFPPAQEETRVRGRQASRQGGTASRQTSRRAGAPAPRQEEEDSYFEKEAEEELVRRNQVAATVPKRRKEIKLTGQRKMKKKAHSKHGKHGSKRGRVANIHSYRVTNEDGSITWGYENEDGSFKEETIGVDCVTHGKYGYIDPTGEVREYSYTSGNRCDPDTRKQIAEDRSGGGGSRGANGHGFYDYKRGKFVMADGRRVTVVVNQQNKARGRRY